MPEKTDKSRFQEFEFDPATSQLFKEYLRRMAEINSSTRKFILGMSMFQMHQMKNSQPRQQPSRQHRSIPYWLLIARCIKKAILIPLSRLFLGKRKAKVELQSSSRNPLIIIDVVPDNDGMSDGSPVYRPYRITYSDYDDEFGNGGDHLVDD